MLRGAFRYALFGKSQAPAPLPGQRRGYRRGDARAPDRRRLHSSSSAGERLRGRSDVEPIETSSRGRRDGRRRAGVRERSRRRADTERGPAAREWGGSPASTHRRALSASTTRRAEGLGGEASPDVPSRTAPPRPGREKHCENRRVSAQEVRRARGRPTKLDQATADRLVDLLRAGSTVRAAAAALDVDRRTIANWRRRAWSQRPEDQPFIELERRLIEALATAPAPALEPQLPTWERIAEGLELEHPERWAAPVEPLDAG
jgi:Homeodomain-like domain